MTWLMLADIICKVAYEYICMKNTLNNGDHCTVIAGSHKGKSGKVQDMNTSKTGAVTITVVQGNGERFKTLVKNVVGINLSQ